MVFLMLGFTSETILEIWTINIIAYASPELQTKLL